MSSTAFFAASVFSGPAILSGTGPGGGDVPGSAGGGSGTAVDRAEASSFNTLGCGGLGLGGGAGEGVTARPHENAKIGSTTSRPLEDIRKILTPKPPRASQGDGDPGVRLSMKKIIALASGLLVATVAVSSFADEAAPPSATAGANPYQTSEATGASYSVTFLDDILNAPGSTLGVPQITVRPHLGRETLIRPRLQFVAELMKSVESI